MLKYFYTTGLIFLIGLFLSLLFAIFYYEWISFYRRGAKIKLVQGFVPIPSLLLGPPLILLFYKCFSWNLIYPVHMYADFYQIFFSAWVPALILIVASGLYSGLKDSLCQEFLFWRSKPFFLFSTSLGLKPSKTLRKIVLLRSLSQSWLRSLPWFFGELLVVEAVFNAPGLAYEAWSFAKVRDQVGMANSMISILIIYLICLIVFKSLNRWLGGKLSSYV